MNNTPTPLNINQLHSHYLSGKLTPSDVVEHVLKFVESHDATAYKAIWIARADAQQLRSRARRLTQHLEAHLSKKKNPSERGTLPPLFGVPFAVKDNIDVAEIPTTCACPAFSYTPSNSAFVVSRILDAGAIFIGKTNLDQFATGLVGTRSPYGAVPNAFDPAYISGGSSSGSAVSVALGMAVFSLGTDTAGSGRVPAMLNNLVGLKPSKGVFSNSGLVPACKSLDCISVFSRSISDAERVFDVMKGFDSADPFSRTFQPLLEPAPVFSFTFGVPREQDLNFFGNAESQKLFYEAVAHLESIGGTKKIIDFTLFRETADLLYEGPWVAERLAAIEDFLRNKSDDVLHPVTRKIITGARKLNATSVYKAYYRLKELKRQVYSHWNQNLIVTPTAGTIYTIAEVQKDPIQTNTNNGFYTNYLNLLDMCAVAVPTGFYLPNKNRVRMPFGVTLVAPAMSDRYLLRIADRLVQFANSVSQDSLGTGVMHLSSKPLANKL